MYTIKFYLMETLFLKSLNLPGGIIFLEVIRLYYCLLFIVKMNEIPILEYNEATIESRGNMASIFIFLRTNGINWHSLTIQGFFLFLVLKSCWIVVIKVCFVKVGHSVKFEKIYFRE